MIVVVVSSDTYYTIPSTIPNDQLHWDSTTDITIKADVYITSSATLSSNVIGSYGGAGVRNSYGFGIVGTDLCSSHCPTTTSRAVVFALGTEGCCYLHITTTTTVSLNTWTTIMVKRISGSYSLYINGISQATNIYTYGSLDSSVIGNAGLPISVGSSLNGQLRNLYVDNKLIGKRYYYHYY